MKISCSSCNSKFIIPDDKIPGDQTVKVNCPKCKNKIFIEPQDSVSDIFGEGDDLEDTVASQKRINDPQSNMTGNKAIGEDQDDDYSLDYYDDVKLALVMADESMIAEIQPAVEERNYKFIASPTIRESLLKFRFHHFDLIVLAEGFDGQQIAGGPIMNYLNHMSMSSRRRMFLALIGDRYKTMDEMMAYALSANMVINTKDLGKFATLLKRGITDNEKFYKVFFDILEEEGKI